ncbi:MAG: hypothetical protein L0216_01475 [Planctomycetales bacterium]|nr:hypothetical protein [Planctomycetales bacterium]
MAKPPSARSPAIPGPRRRPRSYVFYGVVGVVVLVWLGTMMLVLLRGCG